MAKTARKTPTRPKPPANHSAPWSDRDDRLLGTDSDAAIAEKLGRATRSVAVRRWSLGIEPFAPHGRPMKDPETALGQFVRAARGRTSIAKIAKQARISADTWRRIEIQAFPRLGMPALKKVAKALGVDPKKLLELC